MILLRNTRFCTVEVGTPSVRVPLPYREAYFVSSGSLRLVASQDVLGA